MATPYVVNVDDASRPLATDPIDQGQEEIRAIKNKLNTLPGSPSYASTYNSYRNLLINGDFLINQRVKSGNLVTGDFPADRWKHLKSGAGVLSSALAAFLPDQQSAECIFTATTASGALGATDFYTLSQTVEGYNIRGAKFGVASAKTLTLSFWVKASKTGNLPVALRNGATNRSYVTIVPITVANTYEFKTVTVPGDVTGTWAVDNTAGLIVSFCLAAGTSFNAASSGAWTAGNFVSLASGTNFLSAISDTVSIAGVQLEIGSVATVFENIPIEASIYRCQRYYEKSAAPSVSPTATFTWNTSLNYQPGTFQSSNTNAVSYNNICGFFRVIKRAAPAFTVSDSLGNSGVVSYYNAGANNGLTPSSSGADESSFGLVTSAGVQILICRWAANAEL